MPQVVVLLHSKPDLSAVAEQPAETERWERAAARAAEASKRVEAERKAIADAQKIVAIWNARQAGGRAL